MPIKTYSVLEKLERAVEVRQNRVTRQTARVETLREEYKVAHWSKRRDVASRGFRAVKVLEAYQVDLAAAEAALNLEQHRLSQPDAFLRFG